MPQGPTHVAAVNHNVAAGALALLYTEEAGAWSRCVDAYLDAYCGLELVVSLCTALRLDTVQ